MPESEDISRPRPLAGVGVVSISVVVVLILVAFTGGVVSPLLPLFSLPLMLSVALSSFAITAGVGLLLGCSYFVLARALPANASHISLPAFVPGLSYLVVAIVGGLAAGYARRDYSKEDLDPSEREGLLGMAYTDPMTGLYNFRKFRTHLEDELKRAARYGHPLSLILLDLDGFKSVNDRYGHPAGDRVLTEAGEIIRASVRETDLPARYGGEEFVVICPETDADNAYQVAERIRRTLESNRSEISSGDACAITCSAGVATFPDHARDELSLIEAADEALYEAKRNGKNRVCTPASSRAPS